MEVLQHPSWCNGKHELRKIAAVSFRMRRRGAKHKIRFTTETKFPKGVVRVKRDMWRPRRLVKFMQVIEHIPKELFELFDRP